MSSVSIVVYHYVRDLAASRYPAIKGRDLEEFVVQLDHLEQTATVVTAEDVMAAALGEQELPPDAAWLTFDDGYAEHHDVVFPLLAERGWQGSFFVPVGAIASGDVLDVNKAHFVLAASPDVEVLVDDVKAFCEEARERGEDVPGGSELWDRWAHPNRWDPAEVIFVKRAMQRALPEALRHELADRLFRAHVTDDVAGFASELYVGTEDLREMVDAGMYVGSHGSAHHWLDSLTAAEQAADVDRSLEQLAGLGCGVDRWVMCYPYGAYDDRTLEVVADRGCVVGLTTRSGVARLGEDQPLELPRLDTNELPTRRP